jgi:hypothetical protein
MASLYVPAALVDHVTARRFRVYAVAIGQTFVERALLGHFAFRQRPLPYVCAKRKLHLASSYIHQQLLPNQQLIFLHPVQFHPSVEARKRSRLARLPACWRGVESGDAPTFVLLAGA